MTATPDADTRQRVFRVLLDALANPGTIRQLPQVGDPLDLPLLALTDPTTPVATLDATPDEAVRTERLCALTRAPIAEVDVARFVISHHDPDTAQLGRLHTGTDDQPHEAALLIQAAMVAEHPQPDFITRELSGPGITDTIRVHISGVSPDFFRVRRAMVAGHPRGIDVLLVDPAGTVLGLPRTTRMIEVAQ